MQIRSMSTGSIVYNNTGSRRWYISGEIKDVTYEMVAYTSLKAVLNVTGIISRESVFVIIMKLVL